MPQQPLAQLDHGPTNIDARSANRMQPDTVRGSHPTAMRERLKGSRRVAEHGGACSRHPAEALPGFSRRARRANVIIHTDARRPLNAICRS
jgi:hypothetical protein